MVKIKYTAPYTLRKTYDFNYDNSREHSYGFFLRANFVESDKGNRYDKDWDCIYIRPNEMKIIDTEVQIDIPEGYEIMITGSEVSSAYWAFVDGYVSQFKGNNLMLRVTNKSNNIKALCNQELIAEAIVYKTQEIELERVDEIDESEREKNESKN